MKILSVCGNGMGTSTIVKIRIKQICKDMGVEAVVESCSAGESNAFLGSTDILVCTPNWEKIMRIPESVIVVSLMNVMDMNGLKDGLSKAIDEYNNR